MDMQPDENTEELCSRILADSDSAIGLDDRININPVTVYRNKEGERVFKVVNLIEAAESTPEQIETLVSVRNFSQTLEAAADHENLYDRLCIFCDEHIDRDTSNFLCAKCSRGPAQNSLEDIGPYYTFL